MINRYLRILGLVFACGLIILSCSKLTPAGFLKNYRNDLKIKETSDQGPWGGYRIIHWETKNNEQFKTCDILKFVTSNGWTLIDSCKYLKLPDSWSQSDKAVSPPNYDLSSEIFNQINNKLPGFIDSEFKLYIFKTGWIIIDPGTGKENEKTGFILFSLNNRKMTVYHLWGE